MNNIPDNSIIMGIDPGTNIMGFGIIKIHGNNTVSYTHLRAHETS